MEFQGTTAIQPTINPQTVLQVYSPQDMVVQIARLEFGLQGSAPATVPITFDWIIQTSAGTATELKPTKTYRGADEAIQTKLYKDFTKEPTEGSQLISFGIHQQGSLFWEPPVELLVMGGERVGLRYKSSNFVNMILTIYCKGRS